MDIRILRYFLALAEEQTISGAAAKLHTTQPSLSRQLAELENEVGCQLFLRGSRRITLTEEGVFLRKRAQEIVALLEKTESDFASFGSLTEGDIWIGAGESDAMRYLGRAITRVRQEYPNLRFHVRSGNSADLAERLEQGLFDFCLIYEPFDRKLCNFQETGYLESWGLLLPRDHPLTQKEAITREDLFTVPLIYSEHFELQNDFRNWMGSDMSRLQVAVTYNLINTPAMLVESGVGCAFTFDKLVDTSGNRNLCYRPIVGLPQVKLFLVWKKYQVFTTAARTFLRVLLEEFSDTK